MAGKNRRKQALLFPILILFLLGGQALAQVRIKKEAPKPLELNIEDCISATITAPEAMTVYMIGTATEAKEGLIARVTTEKFEIKAGVNHYSAANIPPIKETWIAPKYEGLIKRTGKFPEGNYTILIQLFIEKGELLDEDKRSHEVKYPEIRLISPEDEATIAESNPLFQWSITRPIPGVEYKLSIYEVLESQSPQEAIESGIPWFEGESRTTSLRYPVGARVLEEGKTYCWNVEGKVNDYTFDTSEPRTFHQKGEIAQPESCEYYLDKKGQMWHSLGAIGKRGVRHKLCRYVFTWDGKMYHSDGEKWNLVKADSCTYILAINGMFHFNGRTWKKVRIKKSFCIFDKKMGMMHYSGKQKWTEVRKKKCTYVLTKDGLYHYDGEQWLAEPFKKCTYILAYEGMPFATMYHFNDKTWNQVPRKKCRCILAKNGMFHSDAKKWTKVPDSTCTYAFSDKQDTMYHFDGKSWKPVREEECTYIKAYNGMFHFKDKRWRVIKGRKCNCILAKNGMYHFDGKKWKLVKPDRCTYAYVKNKKKMYHADGKKWKPVSAEECTYVKAYNGMFHFYGQKWKGPLKLSKCRYILAKNGMFHSKGGGGWDSVPGYRCQWLKTDNRGWQHCEGNRKWRPPRRCDYRVEIIKAFRNQIRTRIWHYNGKRWLSVATITIPIGRPEKLPKCTYYFERNPERPEELILYHCEKAEQPREIARIRIERHR